jgi:hypothetical protein
VKTLLDLVLNAHGGLDRWREVGRLNVRLSVSGALFRLKGHPDPLNDVSVEVATRSPLVTTAPFPRPGMRGRFAADRVIIESDDGRVLEERAEPRASFAGHVRETPWDQLQRLYFISYAIWNYLTTPFLFVGPGVESRESEPHQENGETWRRLAVTFPPSIPTHCAEQTFYFDEKGLLQRIDYVTDIAGGVAAHYCFDHKTFGGIVFPTLRRVVPRAPSGPRLTSPSLILLRIHDVAVPQLAR